MSAIFSGRTSAVVHDIPMTHRAGTAEVAKGSAENSTETAANGETTAAAVPAISFGAWPSPITAADVARSRLRLAYPMVIGGEVWWQEARPEEGGRVTVVHRSAGGKLTDVLPAPWNARTRVHEYGGLSYLPFGIGPRICIGAQFALTEATLVLARLVRQFEIGRADDRPVIPVAAITVRPDHPPPFRLRPR